ncbi:hypothetical protein ACFQZE_15545 [Paenibacillus sp. GCM10027627]
MHVERYTGYHKVALVGCWAHGESSTKH